MHRVVHITGGRSVCAIVMLVMVLVKNKGAIKDEMFPVGGLAFI